MDLSGVPPIIKNIMFVCTGNICRSPMAEAIFKKMVSREAEIRAFSSGTHAREANLATENSILVSRDAGIELSNHRAQKLVAEMVGQADMILAMETLHVEYILSLDFSARDKTFPLARFAADGQKSGDVIPDPYGGSLNEYRACFRRIDECVGNLYARIRERLTYRDDKLISG